MGAARPKRQPPQGAACPACPTIWRALSVPLMGGSQSSTAGPPEAPAGAPRVAAARKEAAPLLPVQTERKRVLGLVAMSAIIWFNVSGGPSGSEQIVAAAGPIVGLGLMLFFVVFYSVPQALMTAELSTAFADNGGYSLWVKAAFGDFWAVQESLWSFASGVVDSALYPVLFFHVCQKLVRWAAGYGSGLEQTSCTSECCRVEPADLAPTLL